jgi:ketosteroid isomerase-like protein
MIDRTWARQFAIEWIDAWNAHDLERILSHYADDFEMRSPLIVERMGIAEGVLRGKDAVRPYWQQGLDARPPLRFELHDVLVGVDTLAIYYYNTTRNRMVAEVLTVDAHGKVVSGAGLYADAPGAQ